MNAAVSPGIAGIWPALLTPLRPDLSIDHPRFAAHARALLAAGCAGVTPFGTTGEGPSFSVAERREAVDALIAAGVPASRILVSVSCAALPDAVALTRHAQDIGAWGVLLLPPFYFKGVSDAGIVDACSQVLAARGGSAAARGAVSHPPGGGRGPVARRDRRAAAALPEAHRRHQGQPMRPRAFAGPGRGLHATAGCACRQRAGPARRLAARGSRGAVSGLANFMPRMVHSLATEPDAARTAGAHARVKRLLDWLGGYALIPALKAIMAAQSGDTAWLRVRAPLVALDAERFKSFSKELAAHGLNPAVD